MSVIKEIVGQVTEEEKEDVLVYHSRKLGLLELIKIIPEMSMKNDEKELYHAKIVADIGFATQKITEWWDLKSQKYQWKNRPDGHWRIDFETKEIILEYK